MCLGLVTQLLNYEPFNPLCVWVLFSTASSHPCFRFRGGGGGGSLISQSRLDAGCGCVSCQLAPGTATVTGLVESVTSAAVNVSLCFHLFVWLNLIVSLSHTNCIMHTKSNKCHSLTSELEDWSVTCFYVSVKCCYLKTEVWLVSMLV